MTRSRLTQQDRSSDGRGVLGAVFAGAAIMASCSAAFAQMTRDEIDAMEFTDPQGDDERLVVPALITEQTTLIPGQRNELGIWMLIDPGWHVYWPGQNDTGFPLTAEWEVDHPGVTISDQWVWPGPARYESPGGILDHVYHGQVLVMVPVWVEPDAEGEVTITARLDWLVCEDVCLFEHAEVEITLPITDDLSRREQSRQWSLFKIFEGEWPTPVHVGAEHDGFTIEREDGVVRLRMPGASQVAFYPHESGMIFADPLGEGFAEGDTLEMTLSEYQSSGVESGASSPSTQDDGQNAPPPLRGIFEGWNEYGGTIGRFSIGAPVPEVAPWLRSSANTDIHTDDNPDSREHDASDDPSDGASTGPAGTNSPARTDDETDPEHTPHHDHDHADHPPT